MIRLASYQQTLVQQRERNLKSRDFHVGHLVLKKVTVNTTNPTDGKLGPNWEGPYKSSPPLELRHTIRETWMAKRSRTHGMCQT